MGHLGEVVVGGVEEAGEVVVDGRSRFAPARNRVAGSPCLDTRNPRGWMGDRIGIAQHRAMAAAVGRSQNRATVASVAARDGSRDHEDDRDNPAPGSETARPAENILFGKTSLVYRARRLGATIRGTCREICVRRRRRNPSSRGGQEVWQGSSKFWSKIFWFLGPTRQFLR